MGLFNLGEQETKVAARFADLKIEGKQAVRDLWRQKDVGNFPEGYEASIAPHGVVLVRIFPAE